MTHLEPPPSAAASDHKLDEIELHRRLADHYDLRYGTDFGRIFQAFWNRELLDLVPAGAAGPVLDAGCGTGVLLEDLVERFEEVYGVDLSPDMLARVRTGSPRLKEVRVGDLEETGFPDAFFGTVFCRGSLHHAASRERAFAEMARVTRPGGYLVLTEPSDDFPPVRWARAALYRTSSSFDIHDRAFRRRDLDASLEGAGFRRTALRRFGYLSYPLAGFPDILPAMQHLPGRAGLTRLLTRLDSALSRVPGLSYCAFHMMAVARREPDRGNPEGRKGPKNPPEGGPGPLPA